MECRVVGATITGQVLAKPVGAGAARAFVTIRQLIQHARTRYRWDTRPTTRRLK
jgi:hypothetical protein